MAINLANLRNQMSIKDPRALTYIGYVKRLAAENEVKVNLINEEYVYVDGENGEKHPVNGYFWDSGKELSVACDKSFDEWFPIFVHESCHMEQWLDQCEAWVDCVVDDKDTTDELFRWMDGAKMSKKRVLDMVDKSFNVELDCERRSVKKIIEYKLPIDITEYIQKANSYIYFYYALPETRCFYKKGKEPYRIKEVWSQMPKDLDHDYKSNFPNIMKIYKENGIV